MPRVDLDGAIEAFVRGFCFGRSATHPYEALKIGRVWLMRDGDRKNGEYRNEEYVAHGVDAARMDAVARQHTRGRHLINVIRSRDEDDASIRAAFRVLGYRLMVTEALMAHPLRRIPRVPGAVPIERVRTPAQAALLGKAMRRRPMRPELLAADPPPLRQYMAVDGGRPVGWAASIAAGASRWCSNVYVAPSHRRRGIGKSLLVHMLGDDRRSGASASVLLASHAGAELYPNVGYQHIGQLLMFIPRKR